LAEKRGRTGQRDYTKELHQSLKQKSVEDIFQEIENLPKSDLSQYNEVIE
jgi:hypothetical protein